MFSFGNNGTFGGQKTTQTENNYKKSNEKVETQISEIKQQVNEIKYIIKDNQQELIEILTDLKKQIKKSSKIRSDEEKQEIEEIRPKVTFGGQDPYKSIKKPLKVRSDGQVQNDVDNEEQKTTSDVTFGKSQNSKQNSQKSDHANSEQTKVGNISENNLEQNQVESREKAIKRGNMSKTMNERLII
ncbi:MAG: hypothetical protein J5821_03490 [Alphaproteobacteria bacterium]|nr:hypothetical protein [Alphaproteobacteria bacterium]